MTAQPREFRGFGLGKFSHLIPLHSSGKTKLVGKVLRPTAHRGKRAVGHFQNKSFAHGESLSQHVAADYRELYLSSADQLLYTVTAMPKNGKIHLLNVVALTVNLPKRQLRSGQVGTVVETLAPDVHEVEFSDNDGRAYAMCAARTDQLLVLHRQPVQTPAMVRERGSDYGKR